MSRTIQVVPHDGYVIVRLPSDMGYASAQVFKERTQGLPMQGHVLIDLSTMTQWGSAFAGHLVALYRSKPEGNHVILFGATKGYLEVLGIMCLDRYFTIVVDEAAAVAALSAD